MPAERQGGAVLRYAVGLCRISTTEQGHSGLGLEAQQASVRAFIASQGWTLVAEYSDATSARPPSSQTTPHIAPRQKTGLAAALKANRA